MGTVALGELRRILAVGTGVGISIGARTLQVVAARLRPSGAVVLGHTEIASFRERPAADWGAEYADFLRRLGLSHLAATALLPRSEVIVRQLWLPGVSDREMASAIQYQIDALHPYGEDEIQCSWVRLGRSPAVLVGIARQPVIERYADLFTEAGVKLSSLTFSAAVFYSALRLFPAVLPEGFVTVLPQEEAVEVYGESRARPVFSALLDLPEDRAAALAAAELRLEPGVEPLPLADLIPAPTAAPKGFELPRSLHAYAAAFTAACPRLSFTANLLPPERRSSSSRAVFVPTAALATILLLLAAGLVAQARVQQRRHLAALESEIRRLEPRAAQAAALARTAEQLRARILLLDGVRRRTQKDLDAIRELTRLLEPPAWLSALELTRESATLSGEAEQAAGLLKTLDSSPYFRNSEFVIPIARSGSMELFRIRSLREGAAP
ncbi:MAG TPA: PilN domain-containing protein [Bryobacteraceae bacterium]|nr:PilN domain-containing protein [Bryobacteraceae bacterium]